MLLAASFFQQAATTSSYDFTPRAVASPDAPQKPLVRKRARSGGAEWVQVSRHRPGSQAKKASYVPSAATCMHAQGARHSDDRSGKCFCGPVLGSKSTPHQGFTAGVLEHMHMHMSLSTNRAMFAPTGSLPCLKKATQMTTIQIKCDGTAQCMCCVNRQMGSSDLKNVSTPPPPQTPYISETAFSHRFQKVSLTTPPHTPRADMFAHRV